MENDTDTVGLLYVATIRRGIDYHFVRIGGSETTVCGRSTRTGNFVTPARLVEMGARPCPRCYPDGPPAA
jgi:hypothetical protein